MSNLSRNSAKPKATKVPINKDLDNEVDNIEVELMQVYTEEELEKYKSYQGI